MQKIFDTIVPMMKRLLTICFLPIFLFQGCVYFNDEGIGTRKYRDCTEYYDAEGIYHKECDDNVVEYDDMIEIEGRKLLF
jgi:hypothetical protein